MTVDNFPAGRIHGDDLTLPITRVVSPSYPVGDLDDEAYQSILSIVNFSQNPIRESCIADALKKTSPGKMLMISAVRGSAVSAKIIPFPGIQKANHALVIFGHTYGVRAPRGLWWKEPRSGNGLDFRPYPMAGGIFREALSSLSQSANFLGAVVMSRIRSICHHSTKRNISTLYRPVKPIVLS